MLRSRRDALVYGLFGATAMLPAVRQAIGGAVDPLAPKATHYHPKAKRVIQIFLPGGVSHVDTFDPKPRLQRHDGKVMRKGRVLAASRWGFEADPVSGLQISDLFPHVRSQSRELCLIRSMHGDKGDHFEATLSIHSGAIAGALPGIGAWVSYGMGTENPSLPSHIVFCQSLPYAGSQAWGSNFLPAYHQGTRIVPGNEPISNLKPQVEYVAQQSLETDFLRSVNAKHLESRASDTRLAARMYAYDAAISLQDSAPEVFDLNDETPASMELYGVSPGDTSSFAWQCLMARRMSERGVRFIELIDKGASGNWDAHSNMKSYEKLAKNVDKPIAALIQDLRQRGLLDETLIVCCTEFGRTPDVNESQRDGRDHYKNAFTCWLAGGGVRGGTAYGATDDYGIEIVENPAHINDFHATILHLLGFNHERLTYFYNGRDFRLTGLAGKVLDVS